MPAFFVVKTRSLRRAKRLRVERRELVKRASSCQSIVNFCCADAEWLLIL